MVNKIIKLLPVLLLLMFDSTAQESPIITVPSTPAFSILNYEPASVMRASSVKDLSTDILNSFDENGKLLMNLGIEVAPYWLKSRPTLTHDQYLKPGVGQSILQTFQLSAATVRDSINNVNRLGAGLRFKLLQGKPDEAAYTEKYNALKGVLGVATAVNAANAFVGNSINSREEAIQFIVTTLHSAGYSTEKIAAFKNTAEDKSAGYTDAQITNFLNALTAAVVDGSSELISKVAELSKKRTGFFLEFAAASSFNTNGTGKTIEKTGLWINMSQHIDDNNSFAFSTRYMISSGKDSMMKNLDAGLSYIKETTRFNISVEAMLRWYRAEVPDLNLSGMPITRLEKDLTWRCAAQAAYRVSNDLSINLSLGKDFNSPFFNSKGIFSILGFNYTFLKKEKVDVSQPAL